MPDQRQLLTDTDRQRHIKVSTANQSTKTQVPFSSILTRGWLNFIIYLNISEDLVELDCIYPLFLLQVTRAVTARDFVVILYHRICELVFDFHRVPLPLHTQ